MVRFGTVEMGGTKTSCGVGTTPDDLEDVITFPTTGPEETIDRVIGHLAPHRPDAVGIAAFGPIELRPAHPGYGRVIVTPKAGWSGANVMGLIRDGLSVPAGLDTDVNGAALGEGRWGAGRGLDSFVYITVGTGIGGGALIRGAPIHGLGHPEMGHITVRRHPDDDYPGSCRIHGDCLEGLASGPAIEGRFGASGSELDAGDRARAVEMEAYYLGQLMKDLVYVLAPQRVIVGGGVSMLPGLISGIDRRLESELGGYPGIAEHGPGFVVGPGLGARSGLAGGLVLAAGAFTSSG